jgi:hypothetical protein
VEYRPALSILHLVSRLPWGLKSTRLLQDPFTVSGLRVQALVSRLLYPKIQRSRLLTDLGLLRATKDSNSGQLKDHILLDPAYTATNGLLTVKIRKPSHEFTFGVGISFIPYLLVLTPVV